jgi:hypothetical protein
MKWLSIRMECHDADDDDDEDDPPGGVREAVVRAIRATGRMCILHEASRSG